MRNDMGKLVTERERRGHRATGLKLGRKVTEDFEGPFRAPVSKLRQFGWDSKDFSDVLRPLYGYLHSKTGALWDQVYSEICSTLKLKSMTGRHIMSHLDLMVEKQCYLAVDGNVYAGIVPPLWSRLKTKTGRGSGRHPINEGFYVHPVTGLLCHVPKRGKGWQSAEHKRTDAVTLDGIAYRLVLGQWYAVFVAALDPHEIVEWEVTSLNGKYLPMNHPEVRFRVQFNQISEWGSGSTKSYFRDAVLKDGRKVSLTGISRYQAGMPLEAVSGKRQIGGKELQAVRAESHMSQDNRQSKPRD